MSENRQKLVHLHSASVKVPTAEQLNYGEIAVQYASAEPAFYIKDSLDNIIKFVDASAIDIKIQTAISAITNTVGTLVGEDSNKSIRTISAEEVAKIVASADSRYDTLKEIADWILSDTTGAAKMANDITHLQEISADTRISALEAISGDSHSHTNKTVLDNITSEKVADWDEAAASAHTHDNIDVLTGITSEKVAGWDEAAESAHTHENSDVLDTITSAKTDSWDTAAASAHTHANSDVLDTITSAKTAQWDSAYTVSQSALVGIETGKANGVTVNANNELDFTGINVDCGTY